MEQIQFDTTQRVIAIIESIVKKGHQKILVLYNERVGGSKAKRLTRTRALSTAIKVNVRDIRFTQDTGFSTFSDKRWVAQMMYEIAQKKLDPQDLPLLRVCRSEDGILWSLDNRRLYVFKECRIRSILVEPVEGEASACLEYKSKRFGMGNGSNSDGKVLVIKEATQGGDKKGKASVAALMPCLECGTTALVRFQRLKFMKYNKKAVLDHCKACELLVSWCKKL